MPTLPSVLFHFLGLVGDQTVTAQKLAEFIWKDPALLARALPLLDEGGEQAGGDQGALLRGIASLSRERIRHLAFTTPLLRSFEPFRTASYAVTFWERSFLCATATQAAADSLELPHAERYYAAGLLHDIGYLVVLQQRPQLLPAILQQWAVRPSCLLEIEEELMGIDHCRLGLQTAARLGLPEWLFPAIAAHHAPQQESDWMARLTAVGGAFANFQGVDLFPRRSLSRAARERELHEILLLLLPKLADSDRKRLLTAVETAVRPIRDGIREFMAEWQMAVTSCVQPRFTPFGGNRQSLPAIA
ncbi:MAG TPA: HDOD domain-containing protein [Terriglobia bacterium]|nr:HDOD domain-containing protein [Terriglobia bacterium]